MPFTPEQEAIIAKAGAAKARRTVNPDTNQPGDVPAFNPGVAGYDPQTGTVNPAYSAMGKVGSFVAGSNDIPILGPLVKAGAATGAAAATKSIDAVLGL